jgi:hypothetical protein
MLKIGLIISIGVILLIAWIITSKTRAPKPDKKKFDEVLPVPSSLNLNRHDTVSGKLFKRKYTPLNLEKKKARQEKFWMRKYNYSLQGLYLHTNNKLYWLSHALAMGHKND